MRRIGLKWTQLPLVAIGVAMALVLALGANQAQPQAPNPGVVQRNSDDFAAQREELMKRWGTDKLVHPANVEKLAEGIFAKPLEEQMITDLEKLAGGANRAANFIGFIQEEYSKYYRENYRYDFVQKEVAPFHDKYVEISNKLKAFRNRAYFNLGQKNRDAGNEIRAFFYFRDAFRLSAFTQESGDHKGLRYKAEIEMKKLLGLGDIGTYTYWQK